MFSSKTIFKAGTFYGKWRYMSLRCRQRTKITMSLIGIHTYSIICDPNSIVPGMALNLFDTRNTLQILCGLYRIDYRLDPFTNVCIAEFLSVFCETLPILYPHFYRLRIRITSDSSAAGEFSPS